MEKLLQWMIWCVFRKIWHNTLLIVSTSPPRDGNPNADQCTAVLVDGLTQRPEQVQYPDPREHLQQVQGGLHLVHEEEGCAVTDQKSYSHSELYHSLLKLFVDVDTNKDRLISRASFPKIIDAAAATTKAWGYARIYQRRIVQIRCCKF